jgi:hypothetical protein
MGDSGIVGPPKGMQVAIINLEGEESKKVVVEGREEVVGRSGRSRSNKAVNGPVKVRQRCLFSSRMGDYR